MSGEKLPFISIGITRLVIMFRKTPKIQFYRKRYLLQDTLRFISLKVVVVSVEDNTVHLYKLFGEAKFQFCVLYNVLAAKRVGVDLLDFAAPEIAENVSGRNRFKTAAKYVGKKL